MGHQTNRKTTMFLFFITNYGKASDYLYICIEQVVFI